jgi:hypothetical protein
MHMRAVLVLIAAGACGAQSSSAYRVAVTDSYEVGEDATVSLQVKQVSDDDAEIVITRPDGTSVKEHAPLDTETSRIKLGKTAPHPGIPPTFTIPGTYQIELRNSDETVLATSEVVIKRARLDELLPLEPVANHKQLTRYTLAKLRGKQQWKTYGAIYSLPRKLDRIEILIEEPKRALKDAWKPYAEDATVSVIADNNVMFRERSGSVAASWISGDLIVAMRAPTLADLEQGLIGHFLGRFPSKLGAK